MTAFETVQEKVANAIRDAKKACPGWKQLSRDQKIMIMASARIEIARRQMEHHARRLRKIEDTVARIHDQYTATRESFEGWWNLFLEAVRHDVPILQAARDRVNAEKRQKWTRGEQCGTTGPICYECAKTEAPYDDGRLDSHFRSITALQEERMQLVKLQEAKARNEAICEQLRHDLGVGAAVRLEGRADGIMLAFDGLDEDGVRYLLGRFQ